MKKTTALLFLFCICNLLKAQLSVNTCFFENIPDLTADEIKLDDGGRLLLINTYKTDSVYFYFEDTAMHHIDTFVVGYPTPRVNLLRLDAQNQVIWKVQVDSAVTYDQYALGDQAATTIFLVNDNEIFCAGKHVIENLGFEITSAYGFQILDLQTGAIISPYQVYDTLTSGSEDYAYTGPEAVQSSGRGSYVAHFRFSDSDGSGNNPDSDAFRYVITNDTSVSVSYESVHTELNFLNELEYYQDDSFLFVVYYAQFITNHDVVPYIEVYDNAGAHVGFFPFTDTFSSSQSYRYIRILEKLPGNRYLVLLNGEVIDTTAHYENKLYIIDITNSTVNEIAAFGQEEELVYATHDLEKNSVKITYPVYNYINRGNYHPGHEAYFFVNRDDTHAALYKLDGDTLVELDDDFPVLTNSGGSSRYQRLNDGSLIFLVPVYHQDILTYFQLIKASQAGEFIEMLEVSSQFFYMMDYGLNMPYVLKNTQKLLAVGEYDFFDRHTRPVQLIDLNTFDTSAVINLPFEYLQDAYDDEAGNIYLLAWVEDECDPGTYDAVIYNFHQAVTAVHQTSPREKKLLVYPNPSPGEIWVDLRNFYGEKVQLQLYDLSGKIMHSKFTYDRQYFLDVSDLSPGTYILQAISSGSSSVVKFIIAQ